MHIIEECELAREASRMMDNAFVPESEDMLVRLQSLLDQIELSRWRQRLLYETLEATYSKMESRSSSLSAAEVQKLGRILRELAALVVNGSSTMGEISDAKKVLRTFGDRP